MRPLEGKTALVTGASGALGSALGRILRDAGAKVAGTFRSAGRHDPQGVVDLVVECDLAVEASVISCFGTVRSSLGGPDIVVHCAGGFTSDGMLHETSYGTWNSMIQMNLSSGFLVTREALRSFGEASYGRIVLVSALSAFSPGAGAGAYKVSKSGLRTLVQLAHAERRGRGITINALAPGTIDTPQNRRDMPDADRSLWVSPDEIAKTVVHLCSVEGGAISGDVIPFP